MTAIRRLLAVLGMALAVVVGSSIPASAAFSDIASLPTMALGTATVGAPGDVTGYLSCGPTDSTMQVTWTSSTASSVSGYRVTVHWSDGFESVRDVAATATSWTETTTTYNVAKYSIRYSVTTLTDYGWYTESGLTGSFQC